MHTLRIGLLALLTLASALASQAQTLRIPFMPEWQLLRRVDPEYPAAARQARIQGIVRFHATIGTDGRVERLRLLSGHPLLAPAARHAARQWVYRPTLLRGQAVRVRTIIEIGFWLDAYGNPRNLAQSPRDSSI